MYNLYEYLAMWNQFHLYLISLEPRAMATHTELTPSTLAFGLQPLEWVITDQSNLQFTNLYFNITIELLLLFIFLPDIKISNTI